MRTRPDVKWLINEAAALAGELERIDRHLTRLQDRRESVKNTHDACLHTLAYLVELQSLPALPVVRAHRPYGGRGRLREFLLDSLRHSPAMMFSTAELALQAIAHFGLEFSSPRELYEFKTNTISRALHRLQREGLVERCVGPAQPASRAQGGWRYRKALPSVQEIAVAGLTVHENPAQDA